MYEDDEIVLEILKNQNDHFKDAKMKLRTVQMKKEKYGQYGHVKCDMQIYSNSWKSIMHNDNKINLG